MDEQDRREFFAGKVILAPLTKGGNLPFRRLCVELGAQVLTGEMALALKVNKGARGEMALLRRHPDEPVFGVQLAGRKPASVARAAATAVEHGADFVDLNLGCPIDLFCRRGIGAALMQKPGRVGQIVAAIREAVDVPVSVKMRLGWDEAKPTFLQVARAAVDAGADAVALHGRSRKQRYRRAASWDAVGELVQAVDVPVIGNGDLLTWRDVERAREHSGCSSVLLARGALIKPWLFAEIRDRRDHLLDEAGRLAVLRRYRDLALEHFGADERGRQRVQEFLAWHLDFFNRYRPVPSDDIDPGEHPLIQQRADEAAATDGWGVKLTSTDEADREAFAAELMAELPPPEEAGSEEARSWESPGPPASAILAGS